MNVLNKISFALTITTVMSCTSLRGREIDAYRENQRTQISSAIEEPWYDREIDRPLGSTHFETTHSISEIEDIIRSGKLAIIMFGATWCWPCNKVKEMWADKSVGQFSPHYFQATNDNEWNSMGSSPLFRELLSQMRYGAAAPLMVVVSGGRVLATFAEGDECTHGLAKFLNRE